MTRIRTLVVVPVLTAGALLAGALPPDAAAAGAAATGCATGWGSTPESTATQNSSPLVQIRTGQHACFDRVVFQIAGSVGAGWDVAYVDAVLADGSGELVPVPGGAQDPAVGGLCRIVRGIHHARGRHPGAAADPRIRARRTRRGHSGRCRRCASVVNAEPPHPPSRVSTTAGWRGRCSF
jgi:hypothetical protein